MPVHHLAVTSSALMATSRKAPAVIDANAKVGKLIRTLSLLGLGLVVRFLLYCKNQNLFFFSQVEKVNFSVHKIIVYVCCIEGKLVPSIGTCFTSEGRTYNTGDTWFDGCRMCYCENGREMCSLINCPVLNCTQPVVRVGDCCPSCPSGIYIH